MQLYAFDLDKQIIFARNASRHIDYVCPECNSIVRLRGGLHRQNHFYHFEITRACRQSSKSLEHLNAQLFFLSTLPAGECILEKRFPKINRIADVFWEQKKIVFEIQCSAISRTEVLERSQDYKSLGFEVIWILHDKRYNQKRITSAEVFLNSRLHYFTNINAAGEGVVYDQFSVLEKGVRLNHLKALPIDLNQPMQFPNRVDLKSKNLLGVVRRRLEGSTLYFSNDLVDLSFSDLQSEYIKLAFEAEISYASKPSTVLSKLKFVFSHYILRPYQLLFQILLERACK